MLTDVKEKQITWDELEVAPVPNPNLKIVDITKKKDSFIQQLLKEMETYPDLSEYLYMKESAPPMCTPSRYRITGD